MHIIDIILITKQQHLQYNKIETDDFITWIIKWISDTINYNIIMYDKNTKIYYTNVNSNSPFWTSICNNYITILQQPDCKLNDKFNIISSNITIESTNVNNICSMVFGS